MNTGSIITTLIFVNVLPIIFCLQINKYEINTVKSKIDYDIFYTLYLFVVSVILFILIDKKILVLIPISVIVFWIIIWTIYETKIRKIEKDNKKLVDSLTESIEGLKKQQEEVNLEYKKVYKEYNKFSNLFSLVREINENLEVVKIGKEFYTKLSQYFGTAKIEYVGLVVARKKDVIEIISFSTTIEEKTEQLIKSLWSENKDSLKNYGFHIYNMYSNQYEYFLVIKHNIIEDEGMIDLEFFINETKIGFIRGILFKEVEEMSRVDGLTGLYLRRYFLSRLNDELLRAIRYNFIASLIMIDIDFFKKVNDTYGHIVGDFVLKQLAKILADVVGEQGICSRWGGEEFLIFIPYQSEQEVKNLAEQIRTTVENSVFEYENKVIKITISCGISYFPKESKQIEQLIEIADKKLYKAKQEGRNKVVS